jgi:hypothetical protein
LPGFNFLVLAAISIVQIGVAGLDGELAAVGHGVACVDGEVDEGGFQLDAVDFGEPDTRRAHGLQRDALTERPGEEIRQASEQFVGIDAFRFVGGLP